MAILSGGVIFLFLWPIQHNMHISYVNEKRTSGNVLQRLLLLHFTKAESTFFPLLVRSRRGNLRDIRSCSIAQARSDQARSDHINKRFLVPW